MPINRNRFTESSAGRRRLTPALAVGTAALLALSVLSVAPTQAQEGPEQAAAERQAATGRVEAGAPQAHSPFSSPEMAAPAARDPEPRIPGDAAAHAAAKRDAQQQRGGKPASAQGAEAQSASTAAPTLFRSFEGINQNETAGFRPPDTDGAQGASQFVEVVNSNIRVYNTAANPPTIVSTRSLNSFMNYTATSVFDPRVLFDPVWRRWIVVAEAFPESATTQFAFVAVSTTSNAAGSYFIYRFDRGGSSSTETFFDYPQLGQDQDAVLITGTQFPNDARPPRAEFFCFSKARLYNGLSVGSPVFGNLEPTLAPPNVLDGSATAVLIAAPNNSGQLHTYRATGCGRTPTTLTKPAPISVSGGYSIPPDAEQPGTTSMLDTLDNRFQNRSSQYNNSLWNVHVKAIGSFAVPQWYEVNIGSNTVRQQGIFFASATSDDFNPSLAATPAGRVIWAFSSTDKSNGVFPQIRFTSRTAATPLGSEDSNSGVFVAGSPTFYDPTSAAVDRWGDYSAVTPDTTSSTRAYLVAEKVNSSTVWGSRIAQVGS